jgi:hypothetical protein
VESFFRETAQLAPPRKQVVLFSTLASACSAQIGRVREAMPRESASGPWKSRSLMFRQAAMGSRMAQHFRLPRESRLADRIARPTAPVLCQEFPARAARQRNILPGRGIAQGNVSLNVTRLLREWGAVWSGRMGEGGDSMTLCRPSPDSTQGKAPVIELRCFGGLSAEETAEVLQDLRGSRAMRLAPGGNPVAAGNRRPVRAAKACERASSVSAHHL